MVAGHGFRRRPIIAAGLRPPKRELDGGLRDHSDSAAAIRLRLCPSASVPSDVVSRCTRGWPIAIGPAHIPRCQHRFQCSDGVQGHSRSRTVSATVQSFIASPNAKGPDPCGIRASGVRAGRSA